jgi:hypothetical protein
VNGNAATHELRLVNALSKAVVAAAVWDPAGGVHGTFRYARLGAPVVLTANTEYYLASREVSGGDRWYNATTSVTTSSAASVPGTAYSLDGVTWTQGSVAGRAFGPVDLRYSIRAAGAAGLTGLVAAPEDQPMTVVRIRLVPAAAEGSWILGTLVGSPRTAFVLEFSEDLVTWNQVGEHRFARGTHEVEVLELPEGALGFYRLGEDPRHSPTR